MPKDSIGALAMQRLAAGDAEAAERLCREGLAGGDHDPRLLQVLGHIEAGRGNLLQAEAHLAQAAAQAPEDPSILYNFGVVLAQRGRINEAAVTWRQATLFKPDHIDAWFNLAKALKETGLIEESEAAYRQLLTLSDRHPAGLYNLGNLLHESGRYGEAVEVLRRAVAATEDAKALTNLSLSLAMNGDLEEAITTSEQAIARDPDLVEAHWNFSQILLLSGDLQRGFEEYEWRWKRPETPPQQFTQPAWNGEPLSGRTILLHAEQGLGDAIQFVRYARLVAQRGGRVLLQCHSGLVWLMRDVEGVAEAYPFDAQLPGFDCHAPLMSLPRIFATTLDSIPATVPYLARIEGHRPGTAKRIGLCWQGSPTHRSDRRRSLFAAAFAPLAELPGIRLVSLQKGHGEEQLTRLPAGLEIERLGDDFDAGPDAFRDTVGALSDLDLIITADTAIAHLAGTLAHPVWILLPEPPDWRWLRQRADSPWYPTARLFRQPTPGDWDGVIAAVKRALIEEFGLA